MGMPNLRTNRPTIAVMTNMMATPFSEGVIFGASDYAKQHRYNVICFSGAAFSKPSPINMSRHRIFELIDTSLVDGIVVPMGSLSRFIPEDEQVQFLKQFSDIPIVTVASYLPEYMDVGYSSRQGMWELVAHLKVQHNVERFAYAGATGIHRSTIVKKQMLIEAIEAHGLSFDEEFTITSDTLLHADIPGLANLFNRERHLWPQAIVAGTDNLARTTLTALKQLGIRVPEDVIVTGSMGSDDSLFTEPSLTSIVEPTYELGWHAAERLIAAIEGHPFKDNLVLPTSLKIRHSCGCKGSDYDLVSLPQVVDQTLSLSNFHTLLNQIISNTLPEIRSTLDKDISQHLLSLFINDINSTNSNELIIYLKDKLSHSFKTKELYLWTKLSLCIHHFIMERISQNNNHIEAQLASDILNVVQSYNEKASRYRNFESDKYVGVMREIGIQLNSQFNLEEISLLLADGLNITDYYISIFEDLDKPQSLVRNIMALRDNHCLDVVTSSYNPMQLLPSEIEPYGDVFSLLVMPLSFQEEFLGFCVFSLGERKGVIYEGLLTLFSSAIKNQLHVENLREAEKKFSDIAHSASDWLWEIDTQGIFTYCSDGVESVLGYQSDMIVGTPLVNLLEHPNPLYVSELMNSMAGDNDLVSYEKCYISKSGCRKVLLATGKPIIKLDRIVGYRGAYKDISDIKAHEAHIKQLAYYDPLTNLPNRTSCNIKLNEVVLQSRYSQSKFAVLFIDLDGFKLINDSMGHNAGDILLRKVTYLFEKCTREYDILTRFGGDEFVFIMPNINDNSTAQHVATKMIDILSSPIQIYDQSIFVTASIGISIFPENGQSAESLLINADKAMYQVKQNGKNRFAFYKPEIEEKLQRTVLIRNLLHRALRENNFQLQFQPLVHSISKEITGFEALIRLNEPEDDGNLVVVGPDEFIPIAEEVGLIEQIGFWVFNAVCQQQREWQDAGIFLKCSVNVSTKQFRNPKLASEFISLIEKSGIDPKYLTIEVTESAVIDNEEKARVILQKLSDYGLSIAIDDFGTGYASLSCLQNMPVDTLKIDRSFVHDCTTNRDNAKIISAIITMAKSLNLTIVAEGVETVGEFDFLLGLGGDIIQGYYFARPLYSYQVPSFLNALDV
ncbi:EAL domain-containing protein [Vibrio sp. RC27]